MLRSVNLLVDQVVELQTYITPTVTRFSKGSPSDHRRGWTGHLRRAGVLKRLLVSVHAPAKTGVADVTTEVLVSEGDQLIVRPLSEKVLHIGNVREGIP